MERFRTPQGELCIALHGGIVLGPRRAQLLERIAEAGSISRAGRLLDMSYRSAWTHVSEMNSQFIEPLVQTAQGGRKGGGAALTPMGQAVLARYRAMERRALQAVAADIRALESLAAPPVADPPCAAPEAAPPRGGDIRGRAASRR